MLKQKTKANNKQLLLGVVAHTLMLEVRRQKFLYLCELKKLDLHSEFRDSQVSM